METQDERIYPDDVTVYWDGRFIEWKTREQRPWIYNQDPSDFHKTLSAEWGPYSSAYVTAVMTIAQEHGTSLGPTVRPDDLVAGNTLGENGEQLSLEEIFRKFTMSGLPVDLPVTYETIQMPKSSAARLRAHASRLTLAAIEEHKQRMSECGFPFD